MSDPTAELDAILNRVQGKATALRNNIRNALSSIKHTHNATDDTYRIELPKESRDGVIEIVREGEKVIEHFHQNLLSAKEKKLLMEVVILLETLATVLDVKLSEKIAGMRGEIMK